MENNGREQWDPTFLPQWENLYVYLGIFHGLIAKKTIPGPSDIETSTHFFVRSTHPPHGHSFSESRVTIRASLDTTSERFGRPPLLEISHGGRKRARIYRGRWLHELYKSIVLCGVDAAPSYNSVSRP